MDKVFRCQLRKKQMNRARLQIAKAALLMWQRHIMLRLRKLQESQDK
jgi:hypothetical protein